MIRRTERLGLLFALVFSCAGVAETIAAEIYWTTDFGGVIEKANTDGTGRQTVAQAGTVSLGVALDTAGGKLYWTGVQGRAIRRSNLDGTGIETLVSPSGDPHQIKLDLAKGKMYWSEGSSTHKIMRANLDGSGPEAVIDVADGYASGLALDSANGYLWWMNIKTSTINRSSLDGGGTTQILTTGISPIDLALDLDGGKMYWSENGQDTWSIWRANLDGSDKEAIVATNLWNPLGLALDVIAGKIYWADHGRRTISRANLDGSQVEDVITGLISVDFIALNIPEPTSVLLLALGLSAMLHKRTTHPLSTASR
jgi:sugar lactone lactonase YvrE